MYKPIIEHEKIKFSNLYIFLIDCWRKCLKFSLIMSLLYATYFFIKSPSYSSKLSFYTSYVESSSTSILTSFLGASNPLNAGGLNFSIDHYLESDRLLSDVVEKEYFIEGDYISLVDYWGKDYNKYFTLNPISLLSKINKNIMLNSYLDENAKKSHFAKEKLQKSIKHNEERLSNYHEIVVTHSNNQLTKEIIENIYQSLVNYSNEVSINKASEKKEFILERLNEVKQELKLSEEKMIQFLKSNKDFSSASLLFEKERIEREIQLSAQVYLTLTSSLESAKIDEKDTSSPIFLLDKPEIKSYKAGTPFHKGIIFVFVFFYSMALIYEILRFRKNLFL